MVGCVDAVLVFGLLEQCLDDGHVAVGSRHVQRRVTILDQTRMFVTVQLKTI